MKHDLTILPDDWVLGIWWAEFGPGEVSIMPQGGHWMLLVRLATARDGCVQQVARWIREEAVREPDAPEWRRSISFSGGSVVDQFVFATNQQAWIVEHVHAESGKLHLGGGPDVLRHIMARRPALPTWLSVLIVEQLEPTPSNKL